MNILVTAGNTITPIDRVRVITNVFTGRTGTRIAMEARTRGHKVTLLTSHPEVIRSLAAEMPVRPPSKVVTYRTFAELESAMQEKLTKHRFDVLIHAAAVSDYEPVGLYSSENGEMREVATDGKVKSSHAELWLRMKPTPKLADKVRTPWGFRGTFVKFKLEVGLDASALREVVIKSRAQSDADFIVANTLEGKESVAWIGDREGGWESVPRAGLAARLLDRVAAEPEA
jgi:phosphopantothenate-cysteine ligase/phosphopantothenoylcysteine decarboxylase/phosphopantothenate--cysteine ligase